jgi:hypothetical protein
MPRPAFALPRWLLPAAFAFLCLTDRPAAAQEIQIVCTDSIAPAQTNPTCSHTVPRSAAPQLRRINVRVQRTETSDIVTPIPGALVVFRATGGTIIADSVRTDERGFAYTYWRQSRQNESATVSVEATPPGLASPTAVKIVTVKPAEANIKLRLEQWAHDPGWFEKTPLSRELTIAVYEVRKQDDGKEVYYFIRDEETCAAQRAAFTRLENAGTITPDTVSGALRRITQERVVARPFVENQQPQPDTARRDERVCFINARWRLGEGVGVQSVRATLLPGHTAEVAGLSTLRLDAKARSMPRVIVGPVWTYRSAYVTLKEGEKRTITVERTDSAGVKRTYTETVTDPSAIDSVSGGGMGAVYAGVSFPPVPRWTWLTLTAGVNATDPLNDFYAGISLLRLGRGIATEGLPVDVYLLAHWGRPVVLKDEEACRARSSCETEREVMWHGVGVMATVDASSVISEVIKRIGGG